MSPLTPITTHVALSVHGDSRFFGHAVRGELLGHETFTGLMALAATGRRATPEQRQMLDDFSVIITTADPRIWPLKIIRLAGAYGGTLAGFAAAQLPIEGETIGPWMVGRAAAQLAELRAKVGDRIDDDVAVAAAVLDHVATNKRIIGYRVPLRERDERMDALRDLLASRGRDKLPHWRLQEALSAAMLEKKRVAPNIGAGTAAMLLDLGYAPDETSALAFFMNQNVFVANAVEGAKQAPASMRRLPDECVRYAGTAARQSPRAAAASATA